jgi:pimeloyl-ACP methyl ester carboxylesterase
VPARRPVAIVHGQDQDRESEIDGRILEVAAALTRVGRPVLVFDSRGYGYSAGDRFTLGAKETGDLRGAIDEPERRGLTGSGVDLLGYSMGGAPVLMLTPSEPRVRAVAEDSGYAVLAEVLQKELPSRSGLPGLFTPGTIFMARFVADVDLDAIRPIDTVHRLTEQGVPLLVIHNDTDALIPISHGYRLADAYGPAVQTYFVSGALHVQSYLLDPPTSLARLTQFFDRAE